MARIMLYVSAMLGRAFKSRALVEGKRYAKDRMVFLREFCQNARDANATVIRVTTTRPSVDRLDLIFEDNGRGMSFDHAKQFLFTLYASSKEQESDSAGRFGVGFWSVLLSSPDMITISSRPTKGKPWRIRMDGDLQSLTEIPSNMTTIGTRIVVSYTNPNPSEIDRWDNDAFASLKRYCRYLRRCDRPDVRLPLYFNGTRVDRSMTLDSPCWMAFQDKHMEGAVGVAESPGVEIYARGLPVWQGTVLEELKYGAKRQNSVQLPKGVAPYYLINGHKLNVTYDRRAVVDDRSLRRLRASAKLKMEELLLRYLDQISPRPMHVRLVDMIKRGIKTAYIEHRGMGGMVLLLTLAALVIRFMPSDWQQKAVLADTPASSEVEKADVPRYRVLGNPLTYAGPTTELQGDTSRLGLIYSPKIDAAFRVAAMTALNRQRGIVATPSTAESLYPSFTCEQECIQVGVALNADPGVVVLPVPTGYWVVPESVRLNDSPYPLYLSNQQEPIIIADKPLTGNLVYRAGPAMIPVSDEHLARLLEIPPDMFPPTPLKNAISQIRTYESLSAKVHAAVGFVKKAVMYDASPSVSDSYARFANQHGSKDWMGFVFELGRGDCDVKNTLLIYLLRALGVPARLAVGPVGENGEITALMHAWVEYLDGGWHVADATGGPDEASSVVIRPPSSAVRIEGGERPSRQTVAKNSVVPVPEVIAEPPPPPVSDREVPAQVPSVPHRVGRGNALQHVFLVVFVLGALAMVSMLFVSGRSGRMSTPQDPDDQQVVAAKIAAGALAFPEWWDVGVGIKQRELLTLVSGPPISLATAERLAERGALFVATESNRWVEQAVNAGAHVLDGNSEIFKQVGAMLPAVTDLDELSVLNPVAPAKLDPVYRRAREIARNVNAIIHAAGIFNTAVHFTLKPGHTGCQDINLSALKRRPGHLLVMAPTDDVFGIGNAKKDELITYEALKAISRRSDTLIPHRSRLLSVAAARVFGVKK